MIVNTLKECRWRWGGAAVPGHNIPSESNFLPPTMLHPNSRLWGCCRHTVTLVMLKPDDRIAAMEQAHEATHPQCHPPLGQHPRHEYAVRNIRRGKWIQSCFSKLLGALLALTSRRCWEASSFCLSRLLGSSQMPWGEEEKMRNVTTQRHGSAADLLISIIFFLPLAGDILMLLFSLGSSLRVSHELFSYVTSSWRQIRYWGFTLLLIVVRFNLLAEWIIKKSIGNIYYHKTSNVLYLYLCSSSTVSQGARWNQKCYSIATSSKQLARATSSQTIWHHCSDYETCGFWQWVTGIDILEGGKKTFFFNEREHCGPVERQKA